MTAAIIEVKLKICALSCVHLDCVIFQYKITLLKFLDKDYHSKHCALNKLIWKIGLEPLSIFNGQRMLERRGLKYLTNTIHR